MRVINRRAVRLWICNGIERLRYGAKHERAIYLNTLHALLGVRRRHVGWNEIVISGGWISKSRWKVPPSVMHNSGNNPCRWSVLQYDISPNSASFQTIDMPEEQKTNMAAVKKIVVCGGNGFLGSRICKSAVERGWDVTSIRYASIIIISLNL
jgi:hypothetical protein